MRSGDAWLSKVEIKWDADTPDAEALRACGGLQPLRATVLAPLKRVHRRVEHVAW